MKILHLGNVASVGYNLVKGLRNRGHDVDLFDWGTTDIISREDADWIIRPKRNLLDASDFLALKIGKYDLVHYHTLLSDHCVLQSIKYIMRAGTPVKFVHAHSSIHSGTKVMSPRIKSAIIRFGAKAVFYSTPNIFENIEWFPQKKVFLPNPVEISNREIKETYENRVLIFTEIYRFKGLEKWISIIKKLPQIQFDIIDRGQDRNYFRQILPDNVNYIKQVPHSEIHNLLTKYPLILGQRNSIMSVSELECMSIGIPTLFDWHSNEFYNESLPMPSNIDEKTILDTLGDFNFGNLQREWVVKNHSIDMVVDKLIDEYKQV